MNHPTSKTLPVEFSVQDGVATILLARPERSNAMDAECRALLMQAITKVDHDEDIRAAILTGKGQTFCSGQDLSEPEMDPRADGGSRVSEIVLDKGYNPVVLAIYHCRKPLVCAVNGDAFGGGVNLALACDIVVAAKSAKFVQPYSRLGLTTDAGGSFFLPRLIGRARALGILLLSESVDAPTAQQWGMIWKAVESENLLDVAKRIAIQLARGPTTALAAIKSGVDVSYGHTLEQQLDYERDAQLVLEQAENYQEGFRSFLEKRTPSFR